MTLSRIAAPELPRALGRLHASLRPGETVELRRRSGWKDRFPLEGVIEGAGFRLDALRNRGARGLEIALTRLRTLADVVAPGMRVLFVGLNPSLYSADVGIPFARPGNRFWPAALAAGVLTNDRDPEDAIARHGVGFTDLVKRASASADVLAAAEYAAGASRVAALVEWLAPRVVCFVGLTGYRIALSPRAAVGWQPEPFGGRPAYVMPSPSGRNAHARVGDLTAHFGIARRGAAAPARRRAASGA